MKNAFLAAVFLGVCFLAATGGVRGSAPSAPLFSQPAALAVDDRGDVFIADTGYRRILKLSPGGSPLVSWGAESHLHLEASAPFGPRLTIDGQRMLDVLDGHYPLGNTSRQQIVRLKPSGGVLGRWSSAQLSKAIAIAARGNTLFAAELTSSRLGFPRGRIVKFSVSGKVLSSWPLATKGYDKVEPLAVAMDKRGVLNVTAGAGPCSRGCQGLATFLLERFSLNGVRLSISTIPTSVDAVGPGLVLVAGSVYTASDIHIARLTSQGAVRRVWGAVGCGVLRFRQISDMAAGPDGNLFVSDAVNANVQRVSRNGRSLALWGGCPPPPLPPIRATSVANH